MKVLFIDDDEASVTPAMEKFVAESLICAYSGFDDADTKIECFQPDIVILDLMNGGNTGDPEGNAGKLSYTDIWEQRFCPVIFYSANTDLANGIEADKREHPFVSKVSKGRDSEDRLYERANSLRGPVSSVNETKKNIDEVIQNALRDLAPLIFSSTDFNKTQNESLQYLSRRRIAALMDDGIATDQSIPSWGQYIWPPLNNYPKLGDILLKNGEDKTKPRSFRLVLTPSCDLVKTSTRGPKVDKVLCACCEAIDPIYRGNSRYDKKNECLATAFQEGHFNEYIPLPSLLDMIPLMAANTKKLQLVNYESIDDTGTYKRVASIDSPFREQALSAYQKIAGRIGVPGRNVQGLVTPIVNTGEAS